MSLKVVKPETAKNKEASMKVLVPKNGEFFAEKVSDTFEEAIDVCVEAFEATGKIQRKTARQIKKSLKVW